MFLMAESSISFCSLKKFLTSIIMLSFFFLYFSGFGLFIINCEKELVNLKKYVIFL